MAAFVRIVDQPTAAADARCLTAGDGAASGRLETPSACRINRTTRRMALTDEARVRTLPAGAVGGRRRQVQPERSPHRAAWRLRITSSVTFGREVLALWRSTSWRLTRNCASICCCSIG